MTLEKHWVISPVAGSRRTTTLMLPLGARTGSKILEAAQPARLGIWRISYSPLIHQIICHTKLLKSHAERV
jgi:hypothetical protein